MQPDGSVNPTGVCRAFAAPDLNGDGTDELAMATVLGASVSLLQFYPLPPTEAPKDPIVVESGGPQSVAGPSLPLILAWGGSETHQDRIDCTRTQDGSNQALVTAIHSEPNGPGSEWSVQRTPFLFDGPTQVIAEAPTHITVPAGTPEAQALSAGSDICGTPIKFTMLKSSAK